MLRRCVSIASVGEGAGSRVVPAGQAPPDDSNVVVDDEEETNELTAAVLSQPTSPQSKKI